MVGGAASKLRTELGESLATVQGFDVPLTEAWEGECLTVKPAVAKPCAPKAVDDIAASPDKLPNKLRVIVFIHQKNWTLIQSEGPRRRPAALIGAALRIGWIKTGNESIWTAPFRFKNLDDVTGRFYHDLRRKRERCSDRPG